MPTLLPATPMPGADSARRGGFVLPLMLIALGTVFLLNTMGVMNWNVWSFIARLWPLFLIAFGLELLLGRRSSASSLIATLLVVLVVGGLVTALVWSYVGWGAQTVTTQQITQPLNGAQDADVHIQFGVGTLRLGALTDSNDLLGGSINLYARERLERAFNVSNGTAYLRLNSNTDGIFPFWNTDGGARTWELDLNPDVPIDLEVDSGAGDSNLDLQQLNLTNLTVDGGVGRTTIVLPERGQLTADVNAGVGQVTIKIPEGVDARIKARQGLGNISVNGNFSRNGDTYESPGYDNAANRIDLDVNGGVGQVVVETYEK